MKARQRRFVAEYPVDLNPVQPAIRAGYLGFHVREHRRTTRCSSRAASEMARRQAHCGAGA